jgi:hypothetical protein
MGTQWTKRKDRAEQVADEAWENLVEAIESAGDAARQVGRRTADLASDLADEAQSRLAKSASSAKDRAGAARDRAGAAKDKAASAKDEAWSRAGNALDALAGRRPPKSWGWIGVALLGGIAIGWAVAATAPRAISAAKQLAVGEDDLAPETEPEPTSPAGDYEPPVA